MLVDTAKMNLCVNKVVAEKKEIVFVEGDMIVPDSKPDILNTICTSGVVCVYKKEALEGKVKIDGNINTYIMYLADSSEDKVRGLNTSLDFSENINVSNCTEGMDVTLDTKIKSIECKVINGRKIGIKVALEMTIKIFTNEDVAIINDIPNQDNIQMLKEDLKVNSLMGMGDTRIYAKDNIVIDHMDQLAEILKVDIVIGDKDVKLSYNKVLTKAEAQVKIMYLTEDNQIKMVTGKVPVVGFIDIPNIAEENTCDVNYEIKNMILKSNAAEEHSIYIELEIGVSCLIFEEKQINLIQDLYSPCEMLDFNQKQVTTMTEKQNQKQVKQIREKVNVKDLENRTLLDVDVIPMITEENKSQGRIVYTGEIEMRFIFMDTNGQIEARIEKIPFEYAMEHMEDAENRNVSTEVMVREQDFIVQDGGDVSCNVDLEMNTNSYRNTNLNIMDEIQTSGEREAEDYSLILYIVKKEDTLWKIAKRFGSVVDDIVRTNGIENPDLIYPGQKLYIPRYVRPGASSRKTPMIQYG